MQSVLQLLPEFLLTEHDTQISTSLEPEISAYRIEETMKSRDVTGTYKGGIQGSHHEFEVDRQFQTCSNNYILDRVTANLR